LAFSINARCHLGSTSHGAEKGTGYLSSLDIYWLRDESLEDSYNLPDLDVLAQEIVDDLEAALGQFREIANDLGGTNVESKKQ
jgi:hypothetical protein